MDNKIILVCALLALALLFYGCTSAPSNPPAAPDNSGVNSAPSGLPDNGQPSDNGAAPSGKGPGDTAYNGLLNDSSLDVVPADNSTDPSALISSEDIPAEPN